MVSLTGRKLIGFWLVLMFLIYTPALSITAQDANSHGNYVNVVEWNKDGTILASGSTDETLRTWDAEGNFLDLKKTTFGHNGSILDIEWMKDQETLMTGSVDQSIIVWNSTQNENLPNALQGGFSRVIETIALNPNPSWMINLTDVLKTGSNNQGLPSTTSFSNLNSTFRLDLESNFIAVGGGETSVTLFLHTPSHPVEVLRLVEVGEYLIKDSVKGLDWDATGDLLGIATEDGKIVVMNVTQYLFATYINRYETGLTDIQKTSLTTLRDASILIDYDSDIGTTISFEMTKDAKSFLLSSVTGISQYRDLTGIVSKISTIEYDCVGCINIGMDFNDDESKLAVAIGNDVIIYTNVDGTFTTESSLNTITDLGFENADIFAVDVNFNSATGDVAIAAGADLIVYDSQLQNELFRIVGEIPEPSNIVFIVGVIIILALVAIFIIRRQLKKGNL